MIFEEIFVFIGQENKDQDYNDIMFYTHSVDKNYEVILCLRSFLNKNLLPSLFSGVASFYISYSIFITHFLRKVGFNS